MQEMSFIFVLAFVYVVFAIIQDIRKREVDNWLNFSLIVFALVYRLFYSIFSLNFMFFLYGLAGFVFFFILAHIFYYSKLFAGGDAKLLMGLGAVLPYSGFLKSFSVLVYFVFLLLMVGSVYSLVYSIVIVLKNKKKFSKQFFIELKKNKKLFLYSFILAIVFIILILLMKSPELLIFSLLIIPLLIIILPLLFSYSKAIEQSCMVSEVSPSRLTEGDWLYQDLRIGKKIIGAKWSGLSLKDIKLLKKYKKKVKIKRGIPFTPSFLIALLFLLWNPFWHFVNFF